MLKLAITGGRSSLTESEVVGIRRAYLNGTSISWIAKLYRKRDAVIHNCVLFYTYASIPNREKNRRGGKRTLTPKQIALARSTYERGADKAYVAAMLGVGTNAIEEYLQV